VPPGGDSRANRAVTGAASAARGPADERESPHSMTITRAAPSAVQTRCMRVAAQSITQGTTEALPSTVFSRLRDRPRETGVR
jgi:hypothetical protein